MALEVNNIAIFTGADNYVIYNDRIGVGVISNVYDDGQGNILYDIVQNPVYRPYTNTGVEQDRIIAIINNNGEFVPFKKYGELSYEHKNQLDKICTEDKPCKSGSDGLAFRLYTDLRKNNIKFIPQRNSSNTVSEQDQADLNELMFGTPEPDRVQVVDAQVVPSVDAQVVQPYVPTVLATVTNDKEAELRILEAKVKADQTELAGQLAAEKARQEARLRQRLQKNKQKGGSSKRKRKTKKKKKHRKSKKSKKMRRRRKSKKTRRRRKSKKGRRRK